MSDKLQFVADFDTLKLECTNTLFANSSLLYAGEVRSVSVLFCPLRC